MTPPQAWYDNANAVELERDSNTSKRLKHPQKTPTTFLLLSEQLQEAGG